MYARWTCTGKSGQGCQGPFIVTSGTGKFSNASGQSQIMIRSTVDEVVTTVPERDVTGTFSGQALWVALKYTTPLSIPTVAPQASGWSNPGFDDDALRSSDDSG